MNQKLLGILGGKTEFYPYNLESKYPRVFEKILSLWDSPQIDDYFSGLMVAERSNRAGFPHEVASEILQLSRVHSAQNQLINKQDIWAAATNSEFTHGAWIEPSSSGKNAVLQLGNACSPEGFLRAVEAGDLQAVSLFLDANVNTEIRDERRWTPLMLAAFNGCDELVQRLIQHGANVKAADSGGNTALHWAAFGGYTDCAQMLIENQADIDARNSFGQTPLFKATARCHLKMVLLLIERGADLNATAHDGWTALHKASAMGFKEIIQTLVIYGANILSQNLDGETPIMLAMKNRQESCKQI